MPTTSEILWGIVSGDILSTAWQKLTSNTGSLMSIGFQQIAEITGTPFKQIFNYIGGGATYICYVNGAVASYTTASSIRCWRAALPCGRRPPALSRP